MPSLKSRLGRLEKALAEQAQTPVSFGPDERRARIGVLVSRLFSENGGRREAPDPTEMSSGARSTWARIGRLAEIVGDSSIGAAAARLGVSTEQLRALMAYAGVTDPGCS